MNTILVNPDCMAINFKVYVMRKLLEAGHGLRADEILELCHTEYGVIDLRKLGSAAYVSDIIQHAEVYYPVLVKTDAVDVITDYRILVSSGSHVRGYGRRNLMDILKERMTELKNTSKRNNLTPSPRPEDIIKTPPPQKTPAVSKKSKGRIVKHV